MSNLMIRLGFAAEVGELFANGKHAGLSQDQLIEVLQSQLEFERRLKKSEEKDQRLYG